MKRTSAKSTAKNSVRKFLGEAGGNATMITALAAIPMIASAGMAIDYIRATRSASELQQVADAAALAAAAAKNVTGTTSQQLAKRATIATNYINNSLPKVSDIEVIGTPTVTTGPNTIDVTVKAKVKGSLINVLNALPKSSELGQGSGGSVAGSNKYDTTLNIHSKVGFSNDSYRCLLSMHPDQNQAVSFEGNSEFMANCAVHANSDAPIAIRTWGSAEAYATSFCARGGWAGSGFEPTPDGGCSWVMDPYASMTLPAVGPCLSAADMGLPSSGSGSKGSATTGAFVKNSSYTLPPGTYCGGIEGKTHGVITLQKGIYVLKNGDLKLDAGSEIHATAGTIIYLTGTSSNIDIASGAVVEIVGPNKVNSAAADSTYAYRGWAILQDRSATPTTSNTISSGGDVNIVGGYYAPSQKLVVWANGDMNADSSYFPMITDTLNMSGNATLYVNLDWNSAHLDEPAQLKQTGKVFVSQ